MDKENQEKKKLKEIGTREKQPESKTVIKNLNLGFMISSDKSKKDSSSIPESNEKLPLNKKSNKTTLPASAEKKEDSSQEKQKEEETEVKTKSLINKKNTQVKKKKLKKSSKCGWIFFKQFNYLMEIGSKRLLEKQDMAPLPGGIWISAVKKEAVKILKKGKNAEYKGGLGDLANMENLSDMSRSILGNKNFINFFHKSTKREKHVMEMRNGKKKKRKKPITDITHILYAMISDKIKKAIFLKVIESVIIISLTVMLRLYIPKIKTYSKEHTVGEGADTSDDSQIIFELLLFPIIALVLSFIRYLLKEHAAKFVNQSSSKAAQTLRALLFLKIKNSNISFLKNADNSVVAKMTLFDFEIIVGYVGKLPDLFSFPIIFIMSVGVMVYFVGITALGTFIAFLVAWLILILVTKTIAKNKMRYEFFGSQRATVIMELMEKLQRVKLDKAEILFKNKIEYLRLREEQYMNQVHKYRATASFIMELAPYFSILLVLWLENLRGSTLDLSTTYTVVSIISNMNKPLKRFVNILDRYYEYHHSKKSLNNLLFLIPDKPNEAEYDEGLTTGEVILDNCKIEMVKDQGMRKALGKIFGEDINLQKEMNNFSRVIKKVKLSGDNDHLEEENFSDNPKIRVESKILMKQNFTRSFDNNNPSSVQLALPQVSKVSVAVNINLHIKAKSKIFFINAPGVKEEKWRRKSHPHHVIHSLLGETYIPFDKSLRFKGKVVYQNLTKPTFLSSSSIRENILFGEVMIHSRYKKVIELVALNLDTFPGGDQFEVLFKGNNLSITERKKILLARMLYVSGDIYILEGFFSGSDARKNNYNEIDKICSRENLEKEYLWGKLTRKNGFLEHKTVIVVEDMGGKLANIDNYSEILRQVDKIVVFGGSSDDCEEGILQFNGILEYSEYFKDNENFAIRKKNRWNRRHSIRNLKNTFLGVANNKILKKQPGFKSHNMSLFDKKNIHDLKIKREKNPFKNFSPKNLVRSHLAKDSALNNEDSSKSQGNNILAHLLPGMVSVQKKKLEGRTDSEYDDRKIYKMLKKSVFNYLFISGKSRFIFQFILFTITTTLFITITVYTGAWSNNLFGWSSTKYMLIYLGLSIFTSILGFIRDITFTNMLMKNAKEVHQRLIRKITSMYLPWYSKNYEVNIPFLLSYDIRRIDEIINIQVERGLEALVFVIGGLLVINWIYLGITLIITIACGIYLTRAMNKFFKTTISLVRFIAENTGSFQDVLALTMEEIFEYRVMKCDRIIEKRFQSTSNEMQRAMTHLGFYCKRWLGVKVGITNTVLIFQAYMIPIIVVVFFHSYINLSALELALVISWSLKLVGYLTTLVNCTVSVFNNIVSYGRMEHFLKEVKTEKIDNLKFRPKIENVNYIVYLDKISVTLGKREVLKNISLKIKKGKKVGLLGESGSGKHSLCNLLMRIYDPDLCENDRKSFLLIGKETEDVNHFDQRKKMGYLSSDPIMFSGTVRENIDPGYNFTDEEILSVFKYFDGLNVLKKNFSDNMKDSYFSILNDEINHFFRKQRTEMNLKKYNTIAKENIDAERQESKKNSAITILESIPEELPNPKKKKVQESAERALSLSPLKPKNKFFQFSKAIDQNENISEKSENFSPKRLETESAQVLLTDFENHLITGNLDTEFDKSVNNPRHQTVSELEKKIILKFLSRHVKSSKDFPIAVIKLLKIVKIILEEPLIYIVDKSALEFSPKRSIKETMCLFMSSTSVKKASVILVFNTVFDYMYLLDEIVMMKDGSVVNSGGVEDTLEKWMEDNKAKQFMLKEADFKKQKSQLVEEEIKLKELIMSYNRLKDVGSMIYMMNIAFNQTGGHVDNLIAKFEDDEEEEKGNFPPIFDGIDEGNDVALKMHNAKHFSRKFSDMNDHDSDLPQLKGKLEKYALKI